MSITAGISRISQKVILKRFVSIVPSFQKTLFIKAEIISTKGFFRGRALMGKGIFSQMKKNAISTTRFDLFFVFYFGLVWGFFTRGLAPLLQHFPG